MDKKSGFGDFWKISELASKTQYMASFLEKDPQSGNSKPDTSDNEKMSEGHNKNRFPNFSPLFNFLGRDFQYW